jgi:hypothetical protein
MAFLPGKEHAKRTVRMTFHHVPFLASTEGHNEARPMPDWETARAL